MRSAAKEEPRSARLTGAPPARPYAVVRSGSIVCDVTGDGTISALDTARILQPVVGLRSPCRAPTCAAPTSSA